MPGKMPEMLSLCRRFLESFGGKSFQVFLIKIANQGLNFLLFVFLARLLGVGEFGIYVLAWSWARILLNFSKFGMDMAGTRHFPAYKDAQDWALFRSYYRYGNILIWAKSLLTGIVGALCAWALSQYADLDGWRVYLWAFAVLPFWSLLMFMQPLLRTFKKTISGLVPEMLVKPLSQMVMLALVPLAGMAMTAENAMITALLSCVLAWLVSLWLIRGVFRDVPPAAERRTLSREWYMYALALVLISSGSVVFRQADTVMIGAMIGTGEAGIYGAATRVANLATFVLTSVNLVAGTMISSHHHRGDHDRLQKLLATASGLIFAGTLAISLVLWFGAAPLMKLFGPEFAAGVWPLRWLLLGQVINALSGPVGYLMTLTGHHRLAAQIFTAMIVVNIVLNVALIPILGMNGAAIATAVATALWNIIMSVYVMKHMKLDATVFSLLRMRNAKT